MKTPPQIITTNNLVKSLKENNLSTSFTNKLKIVYRPYICPFDKLLAEITPNSKVFDIGCGSGMFLFLVGQFCNPILLGGIEIDAELIKNAKLLLDKFPVENSLSVYNGLDIPSEISQYDVLVMIDVLHHIPINMQEAFLEQIYQKMNIGSTFIFKDIDAGQPFWCTFNKFHDLVFSGEIGNEWSCDRFVTKAKNIGFKIEIIEKKRTWVYPHYTVKMTK
jgi:2-polyprenyl-3-methyl-5-hydroxy-6-metoxy-1,4-benzoquinol methylase